jgi:hypothetical protein
MAARRVIKPLGRREISYSSSALAVSGLAALVDGTKAAVAMRRCARV